MRELGIVLALMGAVLVVLSVALLAAGAALSAGEVVMLVVGAAFVAGGWWVVRADTRRLT